MIGYCDTVSLKARNLEEGGAKPYSNLPLITKRPSNDPSSGGESYDTHMKKKKIEINPGEGKEDKEKKKKVELKWKIKSFLQEKEIAIVSHCTVV